MAQTRRVATSRSPKRPKPLDAETLRRLSLHYVGRYATTAARLRQYMQRKLRERGWSGAGEPPVDEIISQIVSLGYVDDAGFARNRAAALARRGYGSRKIAVMLRTFGIAPADAPVLDEEGAAMAAALRFAERKRIGPYRNSAADPKAEAKAMAALLRAGHPPRLARAVLSMEPSDIPNCDS